MKKSRIILFSLIMVLGLAFLVGCGKIENPTVADVEKALIKAGYLDDPKKDKGNLIEKDTVSEESVDILDQKEDASSADDAEEELDDEDSDESDKPYEIEITKCKVNEDKGKADVSATLKKHVGPVERTEYYLIEFKLKDDKTWRSKEVEKDTDEEEIVELVDGITAEEARPLLEGWGIEVNVGESSAYLYRDTIESFKESKKPSVDSDSLSSVGQFEVKGKDGFSIVTATIEAKFVYYEYSNSWALDSYETKKADIDFVDEYKKAPSEKELIAAYKDYINSIYIMGNSYSVDDLGITNMKYTEFKPTGSSAYEAPVTFDMELNKAIKLSCKNNARLYFDESAMQWKFSYMTNTTSLDNGSVVDIQLPVCGTTWTGKDNSDKITVKIEDKVAFADEACYLPVRITGTSAKYGDYEYISKVRTFDTEDGEIKLEFVEWVVEPEEGGDDIKNDFHGNIVDGTWKPMYSWYKYSLALDAESADTPDDTPDDEADTPDDAEEED